MKEGKAVVTRRTPFTIKLLFGSSGYKQSATLDIDTGYKECRSIGGIRRKRTVFCRRGVPGVPEGRGGFIVNARGEL